MHYINTLGALCLALSTQLLASPIEISRRQSGAACLDSGVHIISAGGNGTTNSEGLLSNLISSITSSIPGSDLYLPPYDGSANPCAPASILAEDEVKDYASRCPDTPMVLLGYSCGGIVVMNTVCTVGSSYVDNVLAVIAYGEETRVAGEPYNTGTCTGGAPKYARADPSTCDPYAPAIQSYCDSGDPQCCTGGTDGQAHFGYATAYDSDALDFITLKYNAR